MRPGRKMRVDAHDVLDFTNCVVEPRIRICAYVGETVITRDSMPALMCVYGLHHIDCISLWTILSRIFIIAIVLWYTYWLSYLLSWGLVSEIRVFNQKHWDHVFRQIWCAQNVQALALTTKYAQSLCQIDGRVIWQERIQSYSSGAALLGRKFEGVVQRLDIYVGTYSVKTKKKCPHKQLPTNIGPHTCNLHRSQVSFRCSARRVLPCHVLVRCY